MDAAQPPKPTVRDLEREQVFARRDADWRNGPVVYQVFVDRFVPPSDLDGKLSLYPAPKTVHAWEETPVRGENLPEEGVWSHELAFWGGDLPGVRTKVFYLKGLGVDAVYLNPICQAFTNHKYDAQAYASVSPEYGVRQDVLDLAKDLHGDGMRLILDGVFNHMGKKASLFQEALANPESPARSWFCFDDAYPFGYRAWLGVANLPENNLENPAVRRAIWSSADSVVQKYLADGVDGWRLDVAFDLGMPYLSELTESAHAAKPDSVVIGELWNYPETWTPAVDGVMNFHARECIYNGLIGKVSPSRTARILGQMVEDAGLEPMLKAWMILDNHDTPRLKNWIADPALRKAAQVMQFTLPGAPVVYYGTEVGMEGADDPMNRAPMRWDLVRDDNEDFLWMKHLLSLRKSERAWRVGDFRVLDADHLIGYLRFTDRVAETTCVFVNPSDKEVTEIVSLRDSRLMNDTSMRDILDGSMFPLLAGTTEVTVPGRGFRILKPDPGLRKGYSPYKRIP